MPARESHSGSRTIRHGNGKIEDEVAIGPTLIQHTSADGEPYYSPANMGESGVMSGYEPKVFSRMIFDKRGRRPNYSTVGMDRPKYLSAAQTITQVNGEELLQMKDPYTATQKARFEDCYRTDPIVRRAINLIAKFTLGKRTMTNITPMQEFMDPKSERKEIKDLMSNKEMTELRQDIERVNRRVHFHEKLKAAVIQSKIGGRSALLIEGRDEDGFPMDLKVLNWRKLQTVYANKTTWALEKIEYADRNKNDPFDAADLIYLTNMDFHASPDTLYYGLSEIEPVVHVSEANRLIDWEDLPEGNRSSWAHHGLIKFPPNTTDEEIDEFLANFYPGTWNGTSQDVIVETVNLNIAINEIVHERNENDKRILRALGVPAFLIGFEDVSNRATTVAILHAWRESELHDYRTWLQNQLEPQWFDSLMQTSLKGTKFADIDPDNPLHKCKATLEFEDITYESTKEKVEALLPLYMAGIITQEKVLRVLDFDDELERLILEQEENRKTMLKELAERNMAIKGVDPAAPKPQPFGGGGGTGGGFNPQTGNSRGRPPSNQPGSVSKEIPHDSGSNLKVSNGSEVRSAAAELDYIKQKAKSDVEMSALQQKLMQEEHEYKMRLLRKREDLMNGFDKRLKDEESN